MDWFEIIIRFSSMLSFGIVIFRGAAAHNTRRIDCWKNFDGVLKND